MKHKISICIPTYNRCEKVVPLVEKLLDNKFEIDVIVYDNASSDGTYTRLQDFKHHNLKLFKQSYNVGFARNLIDVVRVCETDFVYLISDDDSVNVGFFEQLETLGYLDDDTTGLIYGSVLSHNGQEFYYKYDDTKCKGVAAVKKAAFNHSYMSGMILNKKFVDFGWLDSLVDREYNVLYPHEVMVISILCSGNKLVTLSSIACQQGPPGISFIADENKYFYFFERVRLVDQYKRIIYNKITSKDIRTALLGNLANLSASFFCTSSPLMWGDRKVSNFVKYYISIPKEPIFFFKFHIYCLRIFCVKILHKLGLKEVLKKILKVIYVK